MAKHQTAETITDPFFAFFGAIAQGVARLLETQNRSGDVQRLQKLNDAELAEIGLTRDTIISHVYRDVYYL